MKSRAAFNEEGNAEILGVVILIGIFAITAGIISATILATPEAAKIPAASIEITGSPGAIHITHSGGDPIPLSDLVIRYVTSGGASGSVQGVSDLRTTLFDPSSTENAIGNGYNHVLDDDWAALVLVWNGAGEASMISSWDPTGIYGPLGPSTVSGDVPVAQTPAPTQPVLTAAPTTAWNATIQNITANFAQDRTAAAVGEPVQFTNTSTGNVTIDAWSWQFGDGMTSTERNPVHSYSYAGTYTVTLTASNISTGASDTVVKENCVQVGPPGPSPVDFDMSATRGGVALTVVCTDISASSPTLWRWTTIDGLNGTVTTVGSGNTPVGMNETYNPKVQTFTFYNPAGVVDSTCMIRLEVWSPYFQSPISVTKFVTVGPPMQAEFRADLTNWTGIAGREGATVHFQDISVGIPQSWQWNFGDGVTSTEQNPVHNFTVGPNEIRTFHVTLTVSGWGQTSSVAHNVTIYPSVIANSTATPDQGSAPLEVHFTDTSTGFPTNWLWDFGDGSSSTERNPVHTYTQDGVYVVTLFAERADPHSAAPQTSLIEILVGEEVTADFTGTPLLGDAPLSVQFHDASTNANMYWWTFGDGGTALGYKDPVHAYTVPGNYTVSLRAASDYRTDTETKVGYVSVTGPVTASFTGAPRPVQNGTPVRFTNTSSGNPYTFAWTFGDGATSTVRDPVHAYTKAGTYDVSLTAANPLHTGTSTVPGYIVVYDEVNASFTANITGGPAPLHVKFTDTSTGNPTSWAWDFGDGGTRVGSSPSDQNPVYKYEKPGTYDVTLTASNGYSTQTSTRLRFVITVYGDLTAQFTANLTAGPNPLTVQFNDTTIGNPTTWLWNFDDGGTSAEKNPVHTYTSAGTYNVVLTVSHPHGTLTSGQVPITVYAPITAQFDVNQSKGPAPLRVQFTDTSTGAADSRRWEFGDGAVSPELNPIHAYDAPGNYTANLTVWNHLRTNLTYTTSRTIVSYGVPNAAFTASKLTGSHPLTVRFTDASTGNAESWAWDFNNDGIVDSTEQNPVHIFENGGAYIVKLRVANPAGEDPTPATLTITVM